MVKVFQMNAKNLNFINILRIIRPYQWVKNILVFIPMLMSHQITMDNFLLSTKAFIIFSLIASSIYVINDIADLKSDKKHPFKKDRPLASGLININQCKVLIFSLLILSGFFLFTSNLNFLVIMISYFFISNFYTFVLKKYVFIDLFVLSSLYTLRITAGGLMTDISVSIWLLSFSIFFFISLASVKRQIELLNFKKLNKEEISGRGYTLKDEKVINNISVISAYISILVLIFYINSPQISLSLSCSYVVYLYYYVFLDFKNNHYC